MSTGFFAMPFADFNKLESAFLLVMTGRVYDGSQMRCDKHMEERITCESFWKGEGTAHRKVLARLTTPQEIESFLSQKLLMTVEEAHNFMEFNHWLQLSW